jgi:acetyl esterase/lipase
MMHGPRNLPRTDGTREMPLRLPSSQRHWARVVSPVTDLTLSGASYASRAAAAPLFTRLQVGALADPRHALASPLFAQNSGLPPVPIRVGEDEVLLDDSLQHVASGRGREG